MSQHRYLLKKSRKDKRDLVVSSSRLKAAVIPPSSDLRSISPPVYDQGQVGLCFSHAGSRIFDMDFHTETGVFMTPSRLFLGIMTRNDEGTLAVDAGATLRGTCKAMVKYGMLPESMMPYDTSRMYQLPLPELMSTAEKYQVLKYYSIPRGDIDLMRQTLASGHGIMFGAKIFSSFESPEVAKTGIVPMPGKSEKSLGGHALTLCGHSDEKQAFLVANSWSEKWGSSGYCWMPYSYFTASNLVFDIWVVSQTELGQ